MGKLILGLTLFLLSPLSGASAAESVCLWSGEKINSPSVVKIKLCSLSQISPQLVAQAKADKTFTKLIPTEKNTIRFALMSYVRVSPEKFLALLNDHATIRRLIENIKELKTLEVRNMDELASLNAQYAQTHSDIDFESSTFTKTKIWYGKKPPIGVTVNRLNHTYDFYDEEKNLNSVSNMISADKYFDSSHMIWTFTPFDGGTLIQLYSEDKINVSFPEFVLNMIKKEAPEETVKLISKLKNELAP
ncbi:MAG: hypothetical protein A2X86_10715 [Bdellovibrionales bacterium GWA2_49_15]|nr:MAG: hypothetical protein A2X86_10715 [Bdellovibrionales bacterium GWA2_49_15]HAZ11447.1 hypothetical protein [Bdellovibrionales bacterium]